MTVDFLMPDIGEGIATARIVQWFVAPGDHVAEDQELLEIETDKIMAAIPSPYSGVVLSLAVAADEEIAIGSLLLSIELDTAAAEGRARPPSGHVRPGDVESSPPGEPQHQASASRAPAGQDDPDAIEPHTDTPTPMRGLRWAIAERTTAAWQTIPHITDRREVDTTELALIREELIQRAAVVGDTALSGALTLFALLAWATANVAGRHPALNASVDMHARSITFHSAVNLGFGVATPDGVVAPVVRNAANLSIRECALEVHRLTAAARERRLAATDLRGGTITASNYGALGSPFGTTIISPGQTAIVGFGKAVPKPAVYENDVAVRPIMVVHCSGDHRAMDGRELQAFTTDLVNLISAPAALLRSFQSSER